MGRESLTISIRHTLLVRLRSLYPLHIRQTVRQTGQIDRETDRTEREKQRDRYVTQFRKFSWLTSNAHLMCWNLSKIWPKIEENDDAGLFNKLAVVPLKHWNWKVHHYHSVYNNALIAPDDLNSNLSEPLYLFKSTRYTVYLGSWVIPATIGFELVLKSIKNKIVLDGCIDYNGTWR